MSNYRKTMGQAIEEMYPINEDNMDLMRKAAGGAMQKIKMKDGKLQMDSFTASAIMKVYDKVNPANQKKMATMINKGTKDGMMKLQDFAMKQVKSENDPEIEEEVDLDEGKMKDLVIKGQDLETYAKKSGGVDKADMLKVAVMLKKGDKSGALKYTKKLDTDPRDYILNLMGEEVDLDEVDRSTYDDRIKKFTGMLKDAEKEKPLDKKWISMLKDRIKSTNADQRRLLGMSKDVGLDEAVKHMEVPPDGPRGRGVPMAHPERIGYDSKENQQAYNSITHGTPDNQIDTAKHFMKKGLKGKELHKAVADHHDVIHADVHKQLNHDKKKLHPLHMSFVGEDLDEANKLPDMRNALMQVRTGEVDLDEAQDGGDFKPHMMYDPKTGKGYKADTMDDHLRMKKMGYTHDAPKTEEVELDEAKYTRKLMKDKSVVDYVKSQQARNRKKEQGYEHGANWVELAAKTVGMEKMSLSKRKAFDWESEYEAVAKKLGEEVDLDEGKLGDQWQKGAKSVKSGSFELVRGKSGVHDIMKSGKKIGTFSYDDEGDNFVANMKGERGQLVGNDIDTLISNFKEEVDLDEGKQKPYVSSDSDGKHVMGASGKIVKSFKDMDSANAYLKKNYNKLMKEDVDLDEGKMSQLHQYIKDKKSAEEIAKLMKVDVKTIKTLMSSNNPEDVEESAASDARRAMAKDKDFSRKDSADDDDDATDDDVKGASKNIIMQMRKAQSLNGRFPVEFADKKKVKIPAKMAIAVQQKYNAMKKPADKEKFQAKIGKSYKDMLSALKEELQPKKESILERMNRKIKENKDG